VGKGLSFSEEKLYNRTTQQNGKKKKILSSEDLFHPPA
jgi:hypothetical protein